MVVEEEDAATFKRDEADEAAGELSNTDPIFGISEKDEDLPPPKQSPSKARIELMRRARTRPLDGGSKGSCDPPENATADEGDEGEIEQYDSHGDMSGLGKAAIQKASSTTSQPYKEVVSDDYTRLRASNASVDSIQSMEVSNSAKTINMGKMVSVTVLEDKVEKKKTKKDLQATISESTGQMLRRDLPPMRDSDRRGSRRISSMHESASPDGRAFLKGLLVDGKRNQDPLFFSRCRSDAGRYAHEWWRRNPFNSQ
jgi:hypothetical protein